MKAFNSLVIVVLICLTALAIALLHEHSENHRNDQRIMRPAASHW